MWKLCWCINNFSEAMGNKNTAINLQPPTGKKGNSSQLGWSVFSSIFFLIFKILPASGLPPQSHVPALPGSQVVASCTSFYDLLNESLTQLCFHLYCLSSQNLALPSYSFLCFFTISWDPDNTKSWWGGSSIGTLVQFSVSVNHYNHFGTLFGDIY